MAIRERGTGFQIDVQVKGARYREHHSGPREEAEAREARIKADMKAGKDPSLDAPKHVSGPRSRLTLQKALEECCKRYWSHDKKVHIMIAKLYERFSRDVLLESITTEMVDDYIQDLEDEGFTLSTIKKRCHPLSVAFNHYHKRGNIKVKPAFLYPKGKDNRRKRMLTDEERDEIIYFFEDEYDKRARSDGMSGWDWRDFFVFFMDTGIRPSEIRLLSTRQLVNGKIMVEETKNDNPRRIPLTDRALAAFKRQAYRNEGENPFHWATEGRIAHAWRCLREFKGITAQDDPEFVPYILRHDCATRLYALTKDLLVVQRWMGHKRIETTLIYAKLNDEQMDNARDLMNGPVGQAKLQLVK
ncbi:tyrosine-type recombinase/integrase [Maricaulis maris]|jgi:integrase|uniref:tyrosine-type recombinase/integrase n=1 Tax=Maricaulis maris TaxID=74318 RepID=UPI002926931C|nr:hypothetical protein MACH15_09730 [Maricaulis maris]